MDCYPEYKHHIHPNHQHYGNNATSSNHPYYPGNYGAPSMRYGHAHPSYNEAGQQQNYFAEGYSRYNSSQVHPPQQQNHHHGNYPNSFNGHYGSMRENYHASGEASGQFYYQNAHQTPSGYYGNHSYDSYRNASSNYQYHYGGGSGYHQQQQQQSPASTTAPHSTPPQQQQQQQQPYYLSSYNNEQFNNRYYPTPPPSAPPRDPFPHVHGSSASSSYAPAIENETSKKLNNERLSIEADKGTSNDPVALSSPSSPAIKQSTENVESAEVERKPEVQQTESEKSSSPRESTPPIKSEKPNEENASEGVKADENLDSEEKEQKVAKHENQHQQSTSLFNENRSGGVDADHNHQCNESLTKANGAISQDTAAASDVENTAIATGKSENTRFFKLSIFTGERRRNGKEKRFYSFEVSLNCLYFDSETCN